MLADHTVTALDSWRRLPADQQPAWPDTDALNGVVAELSSYPPLVFAGECDLLRERLARVARGEAFVLQGGDCAETLDAVGAEEVRDKIKTLLQMSAVLTYATSVPVVKIGRIAGQYAKPRSRNTEIRDGVELPVYRGDSVNGLEFTPEARTPDPERLKRVYHASAATLNLIRAFITGGYADLRQSTSGTGTSSPVPRSASATRTSPGPSTTRSPSSPPAAPTPVSSTPRSSSPATRRFCSTTRPPSPAPTRAPTAPTTSPRT